MVPRSLSGYQGQISPSPLPPPVHKASKTLSPDKKQPNACLTTVCITAQWGAVRSKQWAQNTTRNNSKKEHKANGFSGRREVIFNARRKLFSLALTHLSCS